MMALQLFVDVGPLGFEVLGDLRDFLDVLVLFFDQLIVRPVLHAG